MPMPGLVEPAIRGHVVPAELGVLVILVDHDLGAVVVQVSLITAHRAAAGGEDGEREEEQNDALHGK